jgi:hypothetical protein
MLALSPSSQPLRTTVVINSSNPSGIKIHMSSRASAKGKRRLIIPVKHPHLILNAADVSMREVTVGPTDLYILIAPHLDPVHQ